MALNKVMDTTPDAFLAGSIRCENEAWRDVAQLLRGMNRKKLDLARSFLLGLTDQNR